MRLGRLLRLGSTMLGLGPVLEWAKGVLTGDRVAVSDTEKPPARAVLESQVHQAQLSPVTGEPVRNTVFAFAGDRPQEWRWPRQATSIGPTGLRPHPAHDPLGDAVQGDGLVHADAVAMVGEEAVPADVHGPEEELAVGGKVTVTHGGASGNTPCPSARPGWGALPEGGVTDRAINHTRRA